MKILLSYAMSKFTIEQYKTCSRKQLSSLRPRLPKRLQGHSVAAILRELKEPYQILGVSVSATPVHCTSIWRRHYTAAQTID